MKERKSLSKLESKTRRRTIFFTTEKKMCITKRESTVLSEKISDLEIDKTIIKVLVESSQCIWFFRMCTFDWLSIDQALLQFCGDGTLLIKKNLDSNANYYWKWQYNEILSSRNTAFANRKYHPKHTILLS